MPSRKRNKGKQRRAKKEEAKIEALSQATLWRRWVRGTQEAHCNHGCIAIPPPDHAVSRYMDAFDEALDGRCRVVAAAFMRNEKFEEHSEILNNAEYRQMVIDILLAMRI